MKNYLIIDDFFDNPNNIREYALNQKFYSPEEHPYNIFNFPGVRTTYINELDYNLWNNIFNKILLSISQLTNNYIDLDFYDQWNWSSFSQTFEDLKEYLPLWHRDFIDDDSLYFVGVCYLNPNPPKNSGTMIKVRDGNEHIIENKFNRFLIYSNDLVHSSQGSFGKNKNDARMVLTHATKLSLKY